MIYGPGTGSRGVNGIRLDGQSAAAYAKCPGPSIDLMSSKRKRTVNERSI